MSLLNTFQHALLKMIASLAALMLLVSGCSLPPTTAPLTDPAALLLDGFESDGLAWKIARPPTYPDSSATAATLSTQHASQGSQSLELGFEKNASPKAIFILEQLTDLSQAGTLTFDLFNPDTASGVALALSTGSAWTWHESDIQPLRPGAQTVTFDLAGHQYKTAATNWELTSAVAERNATQRIAILIFPIQSGSVFVDHLRLTSLTASPTALQPPMTPALVTSQPATHLGLRLFTTSPVAFERVELAVDTDGVFANPFDPAEADVQVRVTSPQGKTFNVPAFWYQEFDPADLTPAGAAGWRVRFTPTEPGAWQAQAELATPNVQSVVISFDVAVAESARGFVRLHPKNPRYFAFETGEVYFPIGLNLSWATSLGRSRDDYARWFSRLSENGGNVARVWMASWSFGLEWNDTGLGNYAARQKQAWLLDQVFTLAEEHDIYLMLCLLNHGPFSLTTNSEWKDNPYNAENGGPLANPAEFATNAAAKELFKRRLRYIAARWGYSTHLFAWEWWNEVNWTPITDADLKSWTAEMTAVLRTYDPHPHLISTSYANGSFARLWAMPEIDFAQQHDYSGHDPVVEFEASYLNIARIAKAKPILLSEHGFNASGADTEQHREAIHFHNSLWAASFLGYAGSGMAWWWDTYVEPKNLWPEYRGLAGFLRGEDLAALTPARGETGENVYALTLQSQTRALIWVRHKAYDAGRAAFAYTMAKANNQATAGWVYEPPLLSGQVLTLPALSDGAYAVYWYAPQTGEWLSESVVTVSGGAATITIPDLTRDLAVKVVPVGEARTPER